MTRIRTIRGLTFALADVACSDSSGVEEQRLDGPEVPLGGGFARTEVTLSSLSGIRSPSPSC